MSISVQSAFECAKMALPDFFPDLLPPTVRLEEVEKDDTGDWLITVSFCLAPDRANPTRAILQESQGPKREYKVFKIKAENGDFVSMKIRQLACAS